MTGSASTIVLGLGNLLLADEGVGVRAVQRLVDDPRVPSDVTLVDGGTLGLELLSYAAEASRLLILDAADAGLAPGTVMRLGSGDLKGLAGGSTVHQLGAADLLATMRLSGHTPRDVVLLGVQPASTRLCVDLSLVVQASLNTLVEAAVAQLVAWEVERTADYA